MNATILEASDVDAADDLAGRALAGEVIVVRQGMQRAGVFDDVITATYAGISKAAGAEVADAVAGSGLHRIHEHVEPEAIPGVTDAAYAQMTPRAAEFMDRLAATLFGARAAKYFEREPNVRFHIPYDIAAGHRRAFDKFATKRGHGKIGAHGPHRDYWLDCPDNAINVWAAMGPVSTGNGLTVYPEHFDDSLPYNKRGEVPQGVRLKQPMTFDLAPGDIVLFHSKHLHGSEVNRTDDTRAAISFRVTFEQPSFPLGHYHDYRHSDWERGALRPLASWPARMQWSYIRTLFERIVKRMGGKGSAVPAAPTIDAGTNPIALDSIPVGEVRAVSPKVCVARFGPNDVAAFSRFCPHAGADLVDGHLEGGKLVCPWHNLAFDRTSGASGCEALPALKRFDAAVSNGMITVDIPRGASGS